MVVDVCLGDYDFRVMALVSLLYVNIAFIFEGGGGVVRVGLEFVLCIFCVFCWYGRVGI